MVDAAGEIAQEQHRLSPAGATSTEVVGRVVLGSHSLRSAIGHRSVAPQRIVEAFTVSPSTATVKRRLAAYPSPGHENAALRFRSARPKKWIEFHEVLRFRRVSAVVADFRLR
jgi:hypothetical protein